MFVSTKILEVCDGGGVGIGRVYIAREREAE
jgi:hypothetical protein